MKQQFHPLQFVLILLNVLSLAAGIGVFILGLYLDTSYHMSRLYFLDDWFYTFPLVVTVDGTVLAFVSLFGIISATLKRKIVLIIFSSLMLAMVIPTLVTTYAAPQVKEAANEKAFTRPDFRELLHTHIREAVENNHREKLNEWFKIQTDLRCCGHGDTGQLSGVSLWASIKLQNYGFEYDLPESCCVRAQGEVISGCQYKNYNTQRSLRKDCDNNPTEYNIGCMVILDSLYYDEVLPVLDIYLPASLGLVLLEIACGVVAIIYLLQIPEVK